jgi:hypothetical protein
MTSLVAWMTDSATQESRAKTRDIPPNLKIKSVVMMTVNK